MTQQKVIAFDLFGTLVKNESIDLMSPNVYRLLNKLKKDIVILSSVDPELSEMICNYLKIPVVGAYSLGNIRRDEDFVEGGLRVYTEAKRLIQIHFNPVGYVTDKTLDVFIAEEVFGKAAYCGNEELVEPPKMKEALQEYRSQNTELYLSNYQPKKPGTNIKTFRWPNLTLQERKNINDFFG